MNSVSLQAQAREDFGKGAARKLRAKGLIPGLVYRKGGAPRHISVDPHALTTIFRKSRDFNTLVALDIGAESATCLLKATQKHPVSRALLHVDFYEVEANEPVVVEVSLQTIGKAKGLVLGGKVQRLARTVKLTCLPKDIPAAIELDVTDMEIGDMMRVTDVTAPDGCTLVYDQVYNVIALVGRRDALLDEEEAEEGEGDGEAGEEADAGAEA